jgi:Uma2 family endonuclease
MSSTIQTATACALDGDADKLYELVDDQLEAREISSSKHGGVGTRLIIRLGGHVEAHHLGAVYGANTTYQSGGNERIPDVSFISSQRIPAEGKTEEKWHIAPDLAVEVISPIESWTKVNRKLREYFAAGVQQVWLVSLELHEIHVYDSPKLMTVLTEDDELVNEALLPGFRLRISELFQQPIHI